MGSDVVDLTVLDHAGEPLSLTNLKDPVLFEWSTSADTAGKLIINTNYTATM